MPLEPEEQDKLSGLFFGSAGSLTKRRTTISGVFGALSCSSAIPVSEMTDLERVDSDAMGTGLCASRSLVRRGYS